MYNCSAVGWWCVPEKSRTEAQGVAKIYCLEDGVNWFDRHDRDMMERTAKMRRPFL